MAAGQGRTESAAVTPSQEVLGVAGAAEGTAQQPVVFQIDEDALRGDRRDADRFVYSNYFKPLSLTPPPEEPSPEQLFEVMRQLLQSDVGYLFLDRTRITPRGFALGEHLDSITLAPGEEVVLEQKTFSKREVTFEEQSEQEQQFDIELASSLTTELTEGLDRENTRNQQTQSQIAGSFGGNVEGIPVAEGVTAGANVKVDTSFSRTLAEGSRQASRRSVKDSATASRKVAAKYRAIHKTTFKVSTESRFESTSRRVIKNPNQFSPLDVHYFKIMQRLGLTQERYGARLCWAPAVKDPAKGVHDRIAKETAAILERALASVELPARPIEPAMDAPAPKVQESAAVTVPDDVWARGNAYDLSDEIDVAVPIPTDYVWDEDVDFVAQNTRVWAVAVDRGWGWNLEGKPWIQDGQLMVRVHVGCDWKIAGRRGDIHIQAVARFIGDPEKLSEDYKQAYAQWQIELTKWQAEVEAKLAEPRAQAAIQAAARKEALLATLDPAAELIERVVTTFPEENVNEPWEIEIWSQIFEWERASWMLYPAWWSSSDTRDWALPASDFLNASWAKLYVPVRPGFERIALRWMTTKALGAPVDASREAAFAQIESELSSYRTESFGDPLETPTDADGSFEEQVLVLGKWEDILPTDGTHAEVVQGMTSAIDAYAAAEITDARRARSLAVSNEEQDVELKKRAVAQAGTKTPMNVNVEIATEPLSPTNGGR